MQEKQSSVQKLFTAILVKGSTFTTKSLLFGQLSFLYLFFEKAFLIMIVQMLE